MGGGRRLSPIVDVEVEVSSFVGGLWLDASLEVGKASSFRGGLLVIFVCVWIIGLVTVITETGLCVSMSCALVSWFLSVRQTLLWSDGQIWFWSDGQIWFWSDG